MIYKTRISLLYTSARPELILKVLDKWKQRANNWGEIEVVLVTDEAFDGEFENMRAYVNTGRPDCVTGWNLAAKHALGGMFVQVSDDLLPPKNWDQKLLSLAGDEEFYSLQLPDERGVPECVYHPVVSKSVYASFGYLYPPFFKSMYCDYWLFYALAQAGFLKRIEVEPFWNHHHRSTHEVVQDEVMRRHESRERYADGREILVRELTKLGIVVKIKS